MARKKRTITATEKAMFLNLESDDITQPLFDDLFADKVNTNQLVKDPQTGKMIPKIIPSKFNTFDEMTLDAGEYFNKEKVVTNCGLFIFNKYLIEPYFQKEVGYVNFEITKKGLGKIDDMIATAIMLDETGDCVKKYIEYMNRLCWLAFTLNTQICASLSIKTAKP